jgi:hypothetical protein
MGNLGLYDDVTIKLRKEFVMKGVLTSLVSLCLGLASCSPPTAIASTQIMDLTPVVHQPVIFSSDALAFGPKVIPLPDNTFVFAWENGEDIFARHLDAQGSFTGGNFLSTLSFNDAEPLRGPKLFWQADGRLVVTYNELFDIFWHRVNADFSPDGNRFPIENSAITEILSDSTSRTGGGGAIVYTVPRNNGPFTSTVLRFIDPIGQQASNQIFVDSPGQWQQNAVVAGLGNGNVAVAYENSDLPIIRSVRLHIYKPDETDVIGKVLARDLTTNSIPAFPDIAVLTNGSFVVAWQQWPQEVRFSHRSQDGATDQVPANTVPQSSGGLLPKVTALNDGGFLIAWTAGRGLQGDGSANLDMFLQRYGCDPLGVISPIGAQVHLAMPGDQGLQGPAGLSLATLPDGRVILAYSNETGDATNITTLNYSFVSIPLSKTACTQPVFD